MPLYGHMPPTTGTLECVRVREVGQWSLVRASTHLPFIPSSFAEHNPSSFFASVEGALPSHPFLPAHLPRFLVACTRVCKPLCPLVDLLVGRSVGLSVCWSVGLSSKNYKKFIKLYKTLQSVTKHLGRPSRETNSLQKTPQYSLFASSFSSESA